ncbi:transglycosylase SLT domain-containing protein [Sinomonas sp. JGH33]|uniref:Transglycosylase SLT domain-containing protein n=1 Tax=Sinomonas terricola TaxID=3110330 RepID=A0ABU5TB88_9MICC|nr:transglycosylase SLT domain-containing protein [Sinomonas sp. JGH33]MEA5456962.1 transglycosylase SLT domain-containing protein [Sinomonas sp. JGH33]
MRRWLWLLLIPALPAALTVALVSVGLLFGGGTPPAQAACGAAGPGIKDGTVPNGWGPAVAQAAQASGIPASVLAAQLEAESGWNPRAASPAGARGLAQFMPGTWEAYGGGKDIEDPLAAIAAQGRYMGELYRQAQAIAAKSGTDPLALALAGHNAGIGAVQIFHGIPPYAETQAYVSKILANSAKYAAAQGAASPSSSSAAPPAQGACAQAGAAGDGNDLPWAWAPVGAPSPLGMYSRECVDFALWRVNQELGGKNGDFKATNATFRGDGHLLGSANTPATATSPAYSWLTGWQVKGWPTGNTPKPGAVVYYAPGVGGADSVYGHVAVVKALNGDGTYVEEGYNGNPAPDDHKYYTRTVKDTVPSAFLYVPQKG